MTRVNHLKQDAPVRVGPYRLENKLGAGGMGEVYRAWDTRLERPVAIKKMLGKDARRARERLRREARAVARLNHPAIVRIFDLIENEDGDWIIMEFISGRTLRGLLKTRAIVETEAVALGREITEGLDAAHDQGLIHRDLKTENVMVTHLGHVKILDFGLAKMMEDEESTLTPRSRVAGTSRAMSPEQAMGLALDPRSDLFSLGTLLYEMVTGESPFQGPNAYVTMTRVCRHRQRSARDVNPDVSIELSNFIDHLLEKDPDRRPQTAGQVSTVLDALAGIAPLPPSLVVFVQAIEPEGGNALSEATLEPPGRLPASVRGQELRSSIFIWTVLVTDLTNSEDLLLRCGDVRASQIFLRHDRFVRDLLPRYSGLEIDKADGFLLLFRRPIDAVRYAVDHHQGLPRLAEEVGVELSVRTGIHVGEVHLRENPPEDVSRGAKPLEAEGHTRVVAARTMHLARRRQILITQGVYEMARLARLSVNHSEQEVTWKKHGIEVLPGLEEKVAIYEVAVAGATSSPRESTAHSDPSMLVRRPLWRRPGWILAGFAFLALAAVIAFIMVD